MQSRMSNWPGFMDLPISGRLSLNQPQGSPEEIETHTKRYVGSPPPPPPFPFDNRRLSAILRTPVRGARVIMRGIRDGMVDAQKISLNWLNEYVDVDLSAEQVAEILSNLGFPNEGISVVDGDSVIDLEVTSNRGDCLSHIGVARELAAATGKKLRIPKVNLNYSDRDISEFVDVRIETGRVWPLYGPAITGGRSDARMDAKAAGGRGPAERQ
jgi:hypothetical protein